MARKMGPSAMMGRSNYVDNRLTRKHIQKIRADPGRKPLWNTANIQAIMLYQLKIPDVQIPGQIKHSEKMSTENNNDIAYARNVVGPALEGRQTQRKLKAHFHGHGYMCASPERSKYNPLNTGGHGEKK